MYTGVKRSKWGHTIACGIKCNIIILEVIILDDNQLKKDCIYSLRIDKEQMKLLKDNPEIKKEVKELVLQYINVYLNQK